MTEEINKTHRMGRGETADVVVVGAGAAGLMASIWAGRAHPHRTIILLDGARTLGAKILVAGGGRCNVTHDEVDAHAYAGSSRPAIQKVLDRFDVSRTVQFFRELGVELKCEGTGKLFPTTDSARTVLNALLTAAECADVVIRHPCRVEHVQRTADGFCVSGDWGQIDARTVVLATGGKSLPKSGSDGYGHELARTLGHQITQRVFPALVPLTLSRDHVICAISGITVPATLDLWSRRGKLLRSFTDSTLCAHFGLSGPSVLDMSRYYIDAQLDDPGSILTINWLPGTPPEALDRAFQHLGRSTPLQYLRTLLPERLARAICEHSGVAPGTPGSELQRLPRKALAASATRLPLPITGNRGYTYAEVTAGGIPLADVRLDTMASRVCPGLHLCGEICDVDGRIGGYNFQWAWASGYVAGVTIGVVAAPSKD